MATVPRRYLTRYNALIGELTETMGGRLATRLMHIDFSDLDAGRDEAVRVVQAACAATTDEAAVIAAEFYDGLRALQTGRRMGALALADYDPEGTAGAVRAFAQGVAEAEGVEGFAAKCAGRLDYEARRAANRCLYGNARRDPARPRFARVPAGAETCEWCIMLASRGFEYLSEEAAEHSHANCQCIVMPGWGDSPSVAGYDADYYYDCYKNPDDHPEVREALNARRRELYAERHPSDEGE